MKKRLLSILLCSVLCLSCLAGAASAASANPNAYTLELAQTSGTTYDVFITQTAGSDGIGFMQVGLLSSAPQQITVTNNTGSGLSVQNSTGGVIVLHRLNPGDPLTLELNVKTKIATLTLSSSDVLRYDDQGGISNVGYQDEAALTVTISPYTALPAFAAAAAVAGDDGSAAFPLGAAPVADTTYKVYGSADKTASNVTATYVSGTNSVRLSGLPAGPTVFYVAATEPGKNESVPVPVCVWTISEDGSTLNGIAPTAGSALAAQYDSSGRMRCCTVITAAANQAFSLPAAEGASKCSLFFVDANYCPTQPAMNCVLG